MSRTLGSVTLLACLLSSAAGAAAQSAPPATAGLDGDPNRASAWRFDSIAPAGGLHLTIDDMVKYARCNMGEGPLANTCLFAQKPRPRFTGNRSGLVWWTDDQSHIVHHGGDTAGYHASAAIAPSHTTAVVALANGGVPIAA